MQEFGAHIEPEAEARGSERSTRVMSYLYFPYQGMACRFMQRPWQRHWQRLWCRHCTYNPLVKYGVRSQKFIWAPVYSCTHWLRPLPPPPHPSAFGLIYKGAIGQPRQTTSLNPWYSRSLSVTHQHGMLHTWNLARRGDAGPVRQVRVPVHHPLMRRPRGRQSWFSHK